MINQDARRFLVFALGLCGSACAAVSSEPSARITRPQTYSDGHCDSSALDCCPVDPSGRVTQCQLFAQMIDLRSFTRLARPSYTSHMASSFDRTSQGAQPGTAAWLANHDYAQLTPDEPLSLLDTAGPGVVTRLWSANPSGILRVYIDAAEQPVIEAPMRELLRGEVPPFAAPWADTTASAGNLYLPIAFQSRCRITVTSAAKKLFYQVNYRRYASQVQLEPFSLAALMDRHNLPAWVGRVSRVLAGDIPNRAAGSTARVTLATQGAAAYTLRAADGGSLLRELRVHLPNPTPAALRQTMLQIRIDGSDTVRVPLGDFFGSGPGVSPVHALPLGVEPVSGSFVSRWPMPFRRDLRIALEQTADVPVAADVTLVHEPHAFDDDTLLFHALWRAPEWHASEPSHRFTLSSLRGQGVYVGTLLNVTNTDAAWWGEGDEQIWIDGERFPSFFGTGTEDYFGYGWCDNQRFSRAYIGQTRADAHANFGRVSLYRFHVLDAIAFSSSLRFDLEVNHWGDTPIPVEYDSVVYFYARPGVSASLAAPAASQYRIPALDVPVPANVSAAAYRCGGGL